MKALVCLLLAGTVQAYTPQMKGSEPLSPELEARAQVLGKTLRCAVCQGLSVADSPAGMARAQLDKIRELISAGKSDEEVRQYFIARYGEWVLLDPPKRGVGWVVWLLPGLFIGLGGILAFQQLRRMPAASGNAASPAVPPVPEAPSKYLEAVRRELEQ